ncbi:MAG: hypothetical protein EBS86_14065 [Crocinitomicaceae bacterium]|nr:hypothetical protein [Crocinitomicaceae bacterium]
MSRFTFICEDDPMPFADAIITKKTFEFNADHLDSVIGEFETFLRGCGFSFNGHLEIVDDLPLGKKYPKDDDSLDLYTEKLFNNKKSLIRDDEC